MNETNRQPDWDPESEEVQRDQRNAYDMMRERCSVAYSDARGWSVFRHTDVTRILHDLDTFSNAVSVHVAVPNGMDPPMHTAYRRIVDRYFTPDRVAAFEPQCRAIAADIVGNAITKGNEDIDWIVNVAKPFATRVQCAFLGWPSHIQERISQWIAKRHASTSNRNRQAIISVAKEFECFIDEIIETASHAGTPPKTDVISDLLDQRIDGRPLNGREISSILRNFTVGEIGTIAASVGILAHYLAAHATVQERCRTEPVVLAAAIDEILRIDGPLATNRRVTTCPVSIGDKQIGPKERVSINWIAANRDWRSIEEPDRVRFDRTPGQNLLYGAGIHACPGAPLARLELRVFVEELLARTTWIRLSPSIPASRAKYPETGFASLSLQIEKVQ